MCPYSYLCWCGYFGSPWMSFVTKDEFSVRVTKISSRIGVWWTHSLPFCFWPIFNSIKWPYHQKDVIQITLNQATLSNLALPIFKAFVWNMLNVNLSLDQTLLTIQTLYVRQTSIDSGNFSINLKEFCYLYAWSCSFVKERLPFSWDLSLEKSADSYAFVFRWLYLTQCLTSFFSINHLCLYVQFQNTISSINIDKVLLINPFANKFVFGYFNVHHKDWMMLCCSK